MRRAWPCWLLAVVLGTGAPTGRVPAAAAPVSQGWVAGELDLAGRVEDQADQAAQRGDFVQALRLARQALAARQRLQGPGHWQAVDAGQLVERWQRLARLPAATQRQVGQALRNVGPFDRERKGQPAQAEKLLRQALALLREALGENHAETARAYHDLAVVLNAQGRRSDALTMLQKALRIDREVLGEQHPDTAAVYNTVAYFLIAHGKYAEASTLLRKVLAIHRKTLGEEHPDTAFSYNNLSSCLNRQGKHALALPLSRQALAILKKALGEEHLYTAAAYNNVADGLDRHGKHAEALPLYHKALAIRRKVLGEEHPRTANCYNLVALCLHSQAKHAEALPLFRKALATRQKVLGEEHPDTAISYNNAALCLNSQGRHADALPLYRKALQINQKVLGEQHPSTAETYNGVASCLDRQDRHAEALPLFHKALRIRRTVLGEEHADTARSYSNLATCLRSQGKDPDALSLERLALAIRQKVLGEEHPETALSYGNLASCLESLGKPGEALPLYRKALRIEQKVLGAEHPRTATSASNLAYCLNRQGKHAQALSLYEKALAIHRKALGEEHPHTANSYNNLAGCLAKLGKHAEALPVYRKALAIRQKVQGEQHFDTATCYNNVAACLRDLGKRGEAINHLRQALLGLDVSRRSAASASVSFDRSQFAVTQPQARPLLACLLAGEGKHAEAWRHAEAHLARGLLEALAPASPPGPAESACQAELARLDAELLPLFAAEKLTPEQTKCRNDLVRQHRLLLAEAAKRAAGRLGELVWSYPRVQKHLPADAAIVFWLDVATEHFGCVLRKEGEPRWVRLAGSGKAGLWTDDDLLLFHQVLAAVSQPGSDARQPIEQMRRQRLAPLEKHLKAEGKLPAVRRLIVVPTGRMAVLPVELLAPNRTVSYTPSATLLAQMSGRHRPLRGDALLALGDPRFRPAPLRLPEPPRHGLFIQMVLPGSNAARAGLRAGDVLLAYNGKRLESVEDLRPGLGEQAQAVRWRDGQQATLRLGSGPLGAVFDRRSAPAAVRAWHRRETALAQRGSDHAPLPGTAFEVAALRRLVGHRATTLLTGSLASEQQLERMAQAGYLKQFRLIHLATHGEIDWQRPERSALILAQDRLPNPVAQVRQGWKVYDGRLRVRTILQGWQLDADLVVLSACQSGLGKDAAGEGLLGFPQAFLQKGARSVVLSRWKVDDTATALLMVRFYENLLGKRTELKQPMPRAEALAEAKKWLAGLKRKAAEPLAERLVGGVLRGTEAEAKPVVKGKPAKLPEGEKPFAHPYFWAAFVLIGDPS